jgi:UDP-N-acetylmuramyl pentapeptide phosphotransferase/UDP-N-acetylglucosamine-1-phosphate transferase
VTPPAATGAVAACTAAGLSLVLTELLRRVALRYGLTDRPAAHKSHARPTPYLGGVALAFSTLVPAAVVGYATAWRLPTLVLALAGTAVSVIGLVDDVTPLGPGTRLALEALAAALVVMAGNRLDVTGAVWLDATLTATWIVVLTNSFNLLDNMDAAAASIAGVTAATLGVAALLGGQPGLAALLLCLAASCAGFLAHNRPPARIFMGDAGSLFIGFVVAASAVAVVPRGLVPSATGLLLVTFVAVVDTSLVVISRRRGGRSMFSGGTDHVSHRLRHLGLSAGPVAGVLALAAALTGGLGVLVVRGLLPASVCLVLAVVGAVAAVRTLLGVPVVYPPTVGPCP